MRACPSQWHSVDPMRLTLEFIRNFDQVCKCSPVSLWKEGRKCCRVLYAERGGAAHTDRALRRESSSPW